MITEPHPILPSKLVERINGLGLMLLRFDADGGVRPATDDGPWFERALLAARDFVSALVSCHKTQSVDAVGCDTQFPGVYLHFLKSVPQSNRRSDESIAVLMLGREFIESEMLRRICDSAGLDWKATLTRVDHDRLVSAAEARRMAIALDWMQDDMVGLITRRLELRQLSEELANNYEELSLLYKLSCKMSLDQSPLDFFSEACIELQEVSGLGWIALQITEDQPRLQQLRGAVYTAGSIDGTKPVRQLGRELMERYRSQSESVIVDDTSTIGGVAQHVGKNLLVVPLVREGVMLGVLFGGDRANDEHIDSVDAKLCASLCNTLAIFLENLMFLEDAQSMFIGTLHALTSAIDAKDSYTFGHSERVALLSEMLARAAGLDEAIVERVYIAGLVHDVGKIGVPEHVLCKPGHLTDEEFSLVKMHPGIGANMLRDIRQMEDLIPGVLYHHERWDGKGYPEKRAGLDIPLFGRLIGLADAFDAMSSDRTYRQALGLEQVLNEIKLCRGTQFDPELADVFLELDFEPYYQMIQRHHAVKVGGVAESPAFRNRL